MRLNLLLRGMKARIRLKSLSKGRNFIIRHCLHSLWIRHTPGQAHEMDATIQRSTTDSLVIKSRLTMEAANKNVIITRSNNHGSVMWK